MLHNATFGKKKIKKLSVGLFRVSTSFVCADQQLGKMCLLFTNNGSNTELVAKLIRKNFVLIGLLCTDNSELI